MRKGLLIGLIVSSLVVGLLGGSAVEAAKPRVAIINFEVGVSSAPDDIGSGIADMLTTALVKSGKVDVYERSQMQAVLGEQGLSNSGLIDPATAIKMGKLFAVQYIIMGKITEYGVTESGSDIGSFSFKSSEARVAADCRMIDTTSGKIVLADTGVGSESSGGIAESSNNISLGMEGYDTSIIGKATRKSIADMVAKISDNIQIEAKIVSIAGGVVKINLGKGSVEVGQEFEVFRMGEAIKDPDTGEILDIETVKVGRIKVIKVMPKLSDAEILSGTGIKKGDLARLAAAEPAPQ